MQERQNESLTVGTAFWIFLTSWTRVESCSKQRAEEIRAVQVRVLRQEPQEAQEPQDHSAKRNLMMNADI